jgi:hypothetical protein
VASQAEPIQAPTAPSASAAAIWRPQPIPPAASTGTGPSTPPTASMISGMSGVGQRDLHVLARDRMQPAEHPVGRLRAVGQRRHPELQQRLLYEVPVRLRGSSGSGRWRRLRRVPGQA